MNKFFLVGNKKPEYYKSILIKADTGVHNKIVEIIKENCKQGKILDLGCGEGALSLRLFDEGYDVLAVDMNENDFKAKNVSFKKLNFNITAEIEEFAKTYENYFDVVLGIEVIEHIENQWEYVRFLKRLLKPDGLMVISTPNTTSWLSRFYFLFTGQFLSFNEQTAEEYGHISPISPWELTYIVKKNNFKDIQLHAAGFLPKVWITRNLLIIASSILKPLFYFFMKGHKRGWCIVLSAKK